MGDLRSPESPAHAFAREVLKAAHIEPQAICIALCDSIVYRNQNGQVMTAWTKAWPSGKTEVSALSLGMPAWAPEE